MEREILIKKVALSNRETLGYRECGSGNNILLLVHGNMTSSKHWDLFLENIPDNCKVYAIDLRGFGISTYNKPIHSIKDFSEDINLFSEALNLNKFSIMGWSMGSAVAMQFTIDHNNKIKNLISLSGASIKGFPIYKSNFIKNPIYDMFIDSKLEIERYLSYFLDPFKNTNKLYLKALWDAVVYTQNKPSVKRYEEYLDDMLTQRNIIDVRKALSNFNISHKFNGVVNGNGNVDRITVPTLIIHGDKDKVISLNTAFKNKEAIGNNARIEILKNCGHSPLIDKLDELIRLCTEFISV
ncbi:MAG: alpha/beta hydrolase [Clostridium sp.]|nr:alpha/beta hydrolase [Clostridium sp.]